MGKGKSKKRQQDDESEELEDVMAWGKSKQNYYRQSENQYSSASEEQDEAKRIYENQFNALNKSNFYQLPQDNQLEQSAEEEEDVKGVDQKYIERQILWVNELAKLFEGIEDDRSKLRQKVYNSYLLIMLCLREFRIPYIQEHPLLEYLPDLRKSLKIFEKEIPKLYGDENNSMEESIEEQEVAENQNQLEEQEENLKLYEQMRVQKQKQRKSKKLEQKLKRNEQIPKEAFKLVKESEGRLANEKILKNKGLTKRRKKIDGNSRVKLRHKYQKAIVKRRTKGIIGVKENPGRFYQGQSKVLLGKIASTKL